MDDQLVEQSLARAKENLAFLGRLNACSPLEYGWQITVAFYVAVHVVNARIRKKTHVFPTSHVSRAEFISPLSNARMAELIMDEDTYNKYSDLHTSSRSARYDCLISNDNRLVRLKHKDFVRTIIQLDAILSEFKRWDSDKGIDFGVTTLQLVKVKPVLQDLTHFSCSEITTAEVPADMGDLGGAASHS